MQRQMKRVINMQNEHDDENEKKKIKNRDDHRFIMKALSLFTQLGITMASCVIIGLLMGKFIDWLLGTSPWFLIIFVFIGAGAAIKVLYNIGEDWK